MGWICATEASRVNTMHRAISVLSRKVCAGGHASVLFSQHVWWLQVDNLTTTLRVCREHYYKDLRHIFVEFLRRRCGECQRCEGTHVTEIEVILQQILVHDVHVNTRSPVTRSKLWRSMAAGALLPSSWSAALWGTWKVLVRAPRVVPKETHNISQIVVGWQFKQMDNLFILFYSAI